MRSVLGTGIALTLALAGCSSETQPNPLPVTVSPPTIDLGTAIATVLPDGTFSITRNGSVVVQATTPAFTVVREPGGLKDFHDPSRQSLFSFEPLPAGSVRATSPKEGELALHFTGPSDTALIAFSFDLDDGAYLGLGERYDHVDAKGAIVDMYLTIDGAIESGTNDAHVPVPYFVDSEGYGVLVDSIATGAFDLGVTEKGVGRAAFEAQSLDVTIVVPSAGNTAPLAAATALSAHVGLPKMPPLWSFAPMHWRNEWPDAQTLLGDLDQYRSRHIPASTVWFDNPWETSYNTSTLDPARFGDIPTLMATIRSKGFRTIAWSTPYLEKPTGAPADDAQKLWIQADAKSFFVKQGGVSWDAIGCCFDGGLGMIDFTSPAASSFWESIVKHATDAGIDGFKLDYGEDLIPDIFGVRLGIQFADGETERTARSYPQLYHSAYEAALAKAHSDGFVIGRASSRGGAAHVDAIWPGDLDGGFEKRGTLVGGLPAAVVAAQTLATSGFPTFGSDIGGFRGFPTRDSLLRWSEHSAFSLIMQLGGGGVSHNPWDFDENAADIYGRLARQHMQLVPYLVQIDEAAHTAGTPTIRSLPLAFPEDRAGFPFADGEYMLGPDLLVAPVLEGGVSKRTVHFPPGQWVHWFSGGFATGPGDTDVRAELGRPPVFARVGGVIPLYPEGIDTLVDATESGIVSLSDRASQVEVRAFRSAGVSFDSNASWPEGSHLEMGGTGQITLTWTPHDPVHSVFITIDLQAAPVDPEKLSATHAGKQVKSEDDVRASSGSAFAVNPTGDLMWLRLDGPASVTISG